MNETTWRTYLAAKVHRMGPQEKQQFFRDLGVSRTTVQRWSSGEDSPKAANLERLLAILPEGQWMQFLALLHEDPKAWSLLPEETRTLLPQMPPDSIPAEVYASILRAGRNAPNRFWELCKVILRYAVEQLDPHHTGLEIVVARCMPPRPEGKIRSLRADLAMGTPPWPENLHHEECFLGAEALAGYAVSSRHGEMVPDLLDATALLPVHPMEHERSSAAYPIMREGSIAGALIVSSVQAGYFTPPRLTLIEAYADLICLAFFDRDFYPISQIDLALMPGWREQGPYFAPFRTHVEEEYRRSVQGDGPELAQIEKDMLAELEEKLIGLATSSGEAVHS